MPLQFNLPQHSPNDSYIKVIGVGGGGGNAVKNMCRNGIEGVEFIVCNTDANALQNSPVQKKIQLGAELTEGLGCGADPGIGRSSALESLDEIEEILRHNTQMVFVTAGMGGGTGTGGAPVIAGKAREMGILTVGIATMPFDFEGNWRMKIAREGLDELKSCVDTLLVIRNQNLIEICKEEISLTHAYNLADQVVYDASKGIAEIITVSGYMNVDFADVKTIMRDSGTALIGMGKASGENRAKKAVDEALASPLLENVDINGARGLLLNISGSEESLKISEINHIAEHVRKQAGDDARIILGQVYDDGLADELNVTVIATGFHDNTEDAQNFQVSSAQPNDSQPEQQPRPNQQRPSNGRQPSAAQQQEQQQFPWSQRRETGEPSARQQQQPQAAGYSNTTEPEQPAASSEEEMDLDNLPPDLQSNDPQQGRQGPDPAGEQGPHQPPYRRDQAANRRMIIDFSNAEYMDPKQRQQMENTPAYMRHNPSLDYEEEQRHMNNYSRTSVDRDAHGKMFYRKDNPYLWDNVD
jgi:cell division protein FtsZ